MNKYDVRALFRLSYVPSLSPRGNDLPRWLTPQELADGDEDLDELGGPSRTQTEEALEVIWNHDTN